MRFGSSRSPAGKILLEQMRRVSAGPIGVMSLQVRNSAVAIPERNARDRIVFPGYDHEFVI